MALTAVVVLGGVVLSAVASGLDASRIGLAAQRSSDEFDDCSLHAGEPHNIVTEFGQHATVAVVRLQCKHGHANGSLIIAGLHPDDSEDKLVAHKYCPIGEIKEGHEYTCMVAEHRKCDGEAQRRRTEARLGHTGVDARSPWFSYRCE